MTFKITFHPPHTASFQETSNHFKPSHGEQGRFHPKKEYMNSKPTTTLRHLILKGKGHWRGLLRQPGAGVDDEVGEGLLTEESFAERDGNWLW